MEEAANTLTHGVGVLAALTAAATLVPLAATRGSAGQIVGTSIFTVTLVALYSASTAYHAASTPRWKARLKVVDHAAIYLLIAGTYTPFTLGVLGGGWGWSLFGVTWGLAVAGVVFKLFTAGRFNAVSTVLYVAMGWLVLVAAGPLARQLTTTTLAWLLAGGLAYTAGTAFYLARHLRFGHAIWHLFVLTGSLCHAVAVVTIL
ncbi:MAG: hemolysin III family protein [Gemmatimonadota bacterium]